MELIGLDLSLTVNPKFQSVSVLPPCLGGGRTGESEPGNRQSATHKQCSAFLPTLPLLLTGFPYKTAQEDI